MTLMMVPTMMQVSNLLPPLSLPLQTKWRQALQIFREDDGSTHGDIFTPTQLQIVDTIAKRRFPRTQLILPTQYGKSLAVADGVLMRVAHHKERWAIIAPTEDKARIIMDYIIDHIFDDALFYEQLEYHGTKEKLKQERSKTRITFRDGGEVRVYSGNANNSKQTREALMGFGAANVVLDESSLIPDDLYATVKRMLGGSIDNFMLEIGNPFYRNHFLKSWRGDRYKKIFLDVYAALAEGRYSEDYINEMREEAYYDVLYECKFPEASEVLPNGYRRLINDSVYEAAIVNTEPVFTYKLDAEARPLVNRWGYKVIDDTPILGIDVSGSGSNETKFVVRFPLLNFALVAATLTTEDLEEVADKAVELIKQYGIGDYRIAIDATGVGHGLPAILKRRGYLVKAVVLGEKAPEKTFLNMRAWLYWRLRKWLKADGGKLISNTGFDEMKLVYYRQTSNGKTQIEPKEAMLEREHKAGNKQAVSPDTADALMLTCVDTSRIVDEEDIILE